MNALSGGLDFFRVWAFFRSECFQAMDFANQSVNLFRSAYRLPPRCLIRPKSDGELVSFLVGGKGGSGNG
jgi:hypothetical protein